MALRDQPYLPLYIQDFMTDEKLIECSAESTGVYIRLMCLMHKSADYGTILLKQKDKQTGDFVTDFAIKLSRQMPYDIDVIARSLKELIEEKVISVEGDVLRQKRMVKDAEKSDNKAQSGKKGMESRYGIEPERYARNNNCYNKITTQELTTEITNSENEIVVVVDNNLKGNIEKNNDEIKDAIETNETNAREVDPDMVALVAGHYIDSIGTMPPPMVYAGLQSYLDFMEPDVIMDAIDRASADNRRSWSYVNGILKSRKANGTRNMADVARNDEDWEAKKATGTGGRDPPKKSSPFKEKLEMEMSKHGRNNIQEP